MCCANGSEEEEEVMRRGKFPALRTQPWTLEYVERTGGMRGKTSHTTTEHTIERKWTLRLCNAVMQLWNFTTFRIFVILSSYNSSLR